MGHYREGANKRSSSTLSLRLDRIEGVLDEGGKGSVYTPAAAAPISAPISHAGTLWSDNHQHQHLRLRQRQRRHRVAGDVGSGLERFDGVGFAAVPSPGSSREGVHYGQTVRSGGVGGVDVGSGVLSGFGHLGGDALGAIAAEEGRKAAPRIVVYAASTPKEIDLGGGNGGNGEFMYSSS